MQPRVPVGRIVAAGSLAPRSGIVGAPLLADALAPVGGAVGANRTVPASGAGCGGGARTPVGSFPGGVVVLALNLIRPREGGGVQARRGGAEGQRVAVPSFGAGARQVSPVSRPRKSPRGVLCEEEQTPSEGSSGVPLLGPLGSSRNRSSALAPEAPGSRI